ncbi:MAG: ImmA/IrrE family metallo-endopeptidase [Ktedonobacteraceae bacterium]|nr:ImmA/IrrE family metallo-endopeptidase [Ktedonobacteraceae bacterium]
MIHRRSARLEARFSVARKLGIDARSVVDEEGEPRFIWRDEGRFKHLTVESELEQAAISSYGRSLATLLIKGTHPPEYSLPHTTASALRHSILRSQVYVRLQDVIAIAWAAGIPVAHLRVFPAERKRMAAMAVGAGNSHAILLARDSMYPPHIAFYLCHELGHIALGHVHKDRAIVDMDSQQLSIESQDEEEAAADRFALELLTGDPDLRVLPSGRDYNAPGLARAVLEASRALQTEPGTLALCFGYSTQNWAVANSSMRFIYSNASPVWESVNSVAVSQLLTDELPSDARTFLEAVLGMALHT